MSQTRRAALAVLGWIWLTSVLPAFANELVDHPARLSSRDVKIPKPLVKKIEEDYRAFLVKSEVPSNENLKRKLLNVTAEMTAKRGGALHENVRVTAPIGGGVVDLAEFVTPLRGGFQVKIMGTSETGTELPEMHMVYVSKGKTRKIGSEEVGAGCNKYMDITNYYFKQNQKGGFELYTADQRYLSVLAGTFVLYAFEKEALYVGSLTFMDSRYPHLVCEE